MGTMRTTAAGGSGDARGGGLRLDLAYCWAHGCSWVAAWPVARVADTFCATVGRTLRRCLAGFTALVVSSAKIDFSAHVSGLGSRTSAKLRCRGHLIREKIIGR